MVNSQNGYSVLASINDCRRYLIDGIAFYLRPDDCGYVLSHFTKAFDAEVEDLRTTECFGYSRRRIAGSAEWSNHASATAVDLNAAQHPSGRVGTFSTVEQNNIHDLLTNYDEVIRWGGTYRTVKDEMHFEINKNYAAVQLVSQRLRKNNTVSVARLKPGLRNIDTYMVKRELQRRGMFGGNMDKYFGVGLRKAYQNWQVQLGYKGDDADGVPGTSSLQKLGFKVT